jgi:hypothetical protein
MTRPSRACPANAEHRDAEVGFTRLCRAVVSAGTEAKLASVIAAEARRSHFRRLQAIVADVMQPRMRFLPSRRSHIFSDFQQWQWRCNNYEAASAVGSGLAWHEG